ncbi:MAG TPA: hypothetical protein VGR35_01295 [Tepidisphaeraceae bacterium]|nr:hypothetical protein [Tepidisphaeraceae bacterium]
MILQDLYAGRGVGILDPHGDLALDLATARRDQGIRRGRADKNHHQRETAQSH